MEKATFEDFYEVPNLNFDIPRLRSDLDKILKNIEITLSKLIKLLFFLQVRVQISYLFIIIYYQVK